MSKKILIFFLAPRTAYVHKPYNNKEVVKISLYARSDLMSVAIPSTLGGCGATHSRPVTRGVPARTWKLDCPEHCEKYLRGDHKRKVIKVIPGDREKGVPDRMEHVADADPHWSTTPEGIPPTPDEQHVNKIRAEKGAQELQMLQALTALRTAGITIPENALWLLNQTFDPRIIRGTTVCAKGHDSPSGSRYCGECGMVMSAQAEIGSAPDITDQPAVDAIPLGTLHVTTLRKKAREKGLPDKGTKKDLIERLEAA